MNTGSDTPAGGTPESTSILEPEPQPAQGDAPRTSRRRLLALAGAAAAAVLAPEKAAGQRVIRPRTSRPQPPPPSGDLLLLLVRRVTNGVTQEELDLAAQLGFSGYLSYHLNYESIDDSAVEAFVGTNYPALSQPVEGLYQQDRVLVQSQLTEGTIYRAAFSKRQLYERMVQLWTDHFNIYYPKVNYLKIVDDREVVRKHALGNFGDLLWASAHSPAMLEYLDNTRSRGVNVNQNYARELMELHTLGVDGGYTQTDVEEVTRCLTGWTLGGRGNFRFDPTGHDFTAKTVLGTTIPAMSPSSGAAGIQDGEMVLEMLLAHPSTARFISYKMIRWLLRYDPPADLVEHVAGVFTETEGDIPSMIRAIITPANLLATPAKYRQPYQLVLAQLRATQPTVTSLGVLRGQLATLGQPILQWEDPDGWPDNVDWWAGMILQRWNFASFLTTRAADPLRVDVAPLMQTPTAEAVTDAILWRVFGGAATPELRERLRAYLATAGAINDARVREAFALALSSNEFQWY